jgi:response regulator RpfG family c-di-GMP phosphodiesterase
LPNEQAYDILQQGGSIRFGPKVIEVFFANVGEITEIQQQYRDVFFKKTDKLI